jgi:probable F420-dependent oxidoreductase
MSSETDIEAAAASTAPHPIRIGVQLHPQDTDLPALRAAWRAADEMGVDSIFLWDHFFPLYGDANASHYECYTLLAAMAVETRSAQIGSLVTCNSYRNPELLADMSRTIDQLSGGRFVLGIGSGWFERDYEEYGYEFGTAGSRIDDLEAALPRIASRLGLLNPPAIGNVPILIGGSGERRTLRLVAQHASMWNTFGPAEHYAAKSAVLDRHCADIGRNPADIERTIAVHPHELDDLPGLMEAGATHFIFMVGSPYDLNSVESALSFRTPL